MLLVYRSSGRAITITFWNTEEDLGSSVEKASQLRQQAADSGGLRSGQSRTMRSVWSSAGKASKTRRPRLHPAGDTKPLRKLRDDCILLPSVSLT